MNVRRFLAVRFLQILATFFIIMTLLFVLFRMAPGDPVAMLTDPMMSDEEVKLLSKQFGLDQPIYKQYLIYLCNFFQGNFGISFYYHQPVLDILKDSASVHHSGDSLRLCGNLLGQTPRMEAGGRA
jgi:peptide/nickel transport system permease protein